MRVPMALDFHCHLRQGGLMRRVCADIERGGAQLAYVMPNTKPPITSAELAEKYREELLRENPRVLYMMTLYLNSGLTPAILEDAFYRVGVVGVKFYPHGLTTNSTHGGVDNVDSVEKLRQFFPLFEKMQQLGMVLNLHGEVPSDYSKNICVLNAEVHFLQVLRDLHKLFPQLKIVLEHATTREAVECVDKMDGDTVACTITAHHLEVCVDDWAGHPHNYCKPVAKYPADRDALRSVISQGKKRFFLGSDSAPHPRHLKEHKDCCAGVYTSPYLMPYLATILESFGALDKLADFTFYHGLEFYRDMIRHAHEKQKQHMERIFGQGSSKQLLFQNLNEKRWTECELERLGSNDDDDSRFRVEDELSYQEDENTQYAVVPFMSGKRLKYRVKTE